jgi:hypothetical protein
MVEAEEGARNKAGAATRPIAVMTTAAMNRDTPNASHANGIDSTQFCQNVYSKPGALFSVNACRISGEIRRASPKDIRHWLIGRAMVWMSRTN